MYKNVIPDYATWWEGKKVHNFHGYNIITLNIPMHPQIRILKNMSVFCQTLISIPIILFHSHGFTYWQMFFKELSSFSCLGLCLSLMQVTEHLQKNIFWLSANSPYISWSTLKSNDDIKSLISWNYDNSHLDTWQICKWWTKFDFYDIWVYQLHWALSLRFFFFLSFFSFGKIFVKACEQLW